MFEKEAEEIMNNHCDCEMLSECLAGIRTRCTDFEESKKLLIEGIEFGYNKAKEEDKWHYPSKGEYPDENKLVLIYAKNEEGYGHDFMTYHKDNGWYGYGNYCTEVIAWKELEVPKEVE